MRQSSISILFFTVSASIALALDLPVVHDLLQPLPGVTLLTDHKPEQQFNRKLPNVLDSSVWASGTYTIAEFDMDASAPNQYLTAHQYVAQIQNARVFSELGLVATSSHVLAPDNHVVNERDIAGVLVKADDTECEHVDKAATLIQKYGFNFAHFIADAFPRVALLLPLLKYDPSIKLLVWGSAHEVAWLQLLGISQDRLVVYNPSSVYCVRELLYPSPGRLNSPSREALALARDKVAGLLNITYTPLSGLPPAALAQRPVLYISRKGTSSRDVSNEEELLAALRARFPSETIVACSAEDMTPAEAVAAFADAKAVIGPHGAGMMFAQMFAPKGAAFVVLEFTAHTPPGFTHMAAAQEQLLWVVPVGQFGWLSPNLTAPVGDVLATVTLALAQQSGIHGRCPPGHVYDEDAAYCMPCAPGTFATGHESRAQGCTACAPGSVNPLHEAASCHMCPRGTYASGAAGECLACPADAPKTLWPASNSAALCVADVAHDPRATAEHPDPPSLVRKLSGLYHYASLYAPQLLRSSDYHARMLAEVVNGAPCGYGGYGYNRYSYSYTYSGYGYYGYGYTNCDTNTNTGKTQSTPVESSPPVQLYLRFRFNGDYFVLSANNARFTDFKVMVQRQLTLGFPMASAVVLLAVYPGSIVVDTAVTFPSAAVANAAVAAFQAALATYFPASLLQQFGISGVTMERLNALPAVPNITPRPVAAAEEDLAWIAGPVVGGVVGLMVVAGVSYLVVRRRRARKSALVGATDMEAGSDCNTHTTLLLAPEEPQRPSPTHSAKGDAPVALPRYSPPPAPAPVPAAAVFSPSAPMYPPVPPPYTSLVPSAPDLVAAPVAAAYRPSTRPQVTVTAVALHEQEQAHAAAAAPLPSAVPEAPAAPDVSQPAGAAVAAAAPATSPASVPPAPEVPASPSNVPSLPPLGGSTRVPALPPM